MAKPSSSLALAGLSLVLLARAAAAQSAEGAPAPVPSPRAAALSAAEARAAEARAVAWYGTPYVAETEAPHGAGAVVDGVDLTPDGSRGVTRRFQLFDRLILTAPVGRPGAVGDSLLLVRRGPALGTGQVLLPTGIAVVDGIAGSLRTARLVRVYDVVAAEQAVLPLPALPAVDSTVRSAGGRETSIVWIDGGAELPSLQRVVVLAGGAATSLREGDRLEVVGDGRRIAGGPVLPGTRAAVVRVVRVTAQGASARIESQTQPVVSIGMAARTLP